MDPPVVFDRGKLLAWIFFTVLKRTAWLRRKKRTRQARLVEVGVGDYSVWETSEASSSCHALGLQREDFDSESEWEAYQLGYTARAGGP